METDAPLTTALTVMGPIVLERPSEQYRPLKGRLAEVRTCKLLMPHAGKPATNEAQTCPWAEAEASVCWYLFGPLAADGLLAIRFWF